MDAGESVALVLGSGISGLLAARVLSAHFERVVLLDKRAYDERTGTFERGVPQSDHLHVLLKRGQQIIDGLFPGVLAELAAAGGPTNDWGSTTFWVNPFGVHPLHETDIRTVQFSRNALDRALLSRLLTSDNVSVRSAQVTALLGSKELGRVTGVRAKLKTDAGGTEVQELRADLVVDCRGRSSTVIADLATLGYAAPPISSVENEMGYASCEFDVPDETKIPWRLVYLQVRPGRVDRGVAVNQIGPKRVIVTLLGTGADRPTRPEPEFRAFARDLAYPHAHDVIETAQARGQPKLWRKLSNERRHFGKMRQWPRGLLVLGDALCAFNPVYGQGMTVAAVEAEALGKVLAATPDLRAAPWEMQFQRALEGLLFIPWFMSTTEDMRNRKFAAPKLHIRALHAYFDLVLRSAIGDPVLHLNFLQIMHMMRSPFSLMGPGALIRVARRTLGRVFGKGRLSRSSEAPHSAQSIEAQPLISPRLFAARAHSTSALEP